MHELLAASVLQGFVLFFQIINVSFPCYIGYQIFIGIFFSHMFADNGFIG